MIAFDASSARKRDENGYLHVAMSRLTREQVTDYYGHEIPMGDELGLEPDKVYKVYRPANELIKAVETFNSLPILIRHEADSAQDPQKHLRVGALGTDAAFDGEYITNALVFHDATAIALIEDGSQKELSAGYFYDPILEDGEWKGQTYQIRMTNIRGNHIALVQLGRAGSTCVVADEKIKKREDKSKMKNETQTLLKKLKALLTSDNILDPAADSDDDMGEDNDIKSTLIAKLRELGSSHGAEGSVIDELISMVEKLAGGAMDNDPDDLNKDSDKDLNEDSDKDTDKKMTGDSRSMNFDISKMKNELRAQLQSELQAEFAAMAQAAEETKTVLGNINVLAFDSAEGIYRHALKTCKRDVKNVPLGAAKAVFDEYLRGRDAIYQESIAMDAEIPETFLDNLDLSHVRRG